MNDDKWQVCLGEKGLNLISTILFGSTILNVPLLAATSPATSFNLIINEKAILEEEERGREGRGGRAKPQTENRLMR